MSSKKKQDVLKEEKDWNRVDDVVFESGSFLIKYQKQLLIGVGVVVIIACLAFAYKTLYLKPITEEAQAAIFKGEQYFQSRQDSLALFGDGNGYIGFEAIINEFGASKTSDLAKYYAGISYSRLGNDEQAIKYLKDFSGGDHLITYAAKGALGNSYVNTGKLEDGAKAFIDAAKGADDSFLSPVFYKKAAVVYRDLKNHDKVIELFTLLKNNYAESMEASDADKYIEEANLLKASK